jgi:putative aldouronate transport system permease protein
MAKTSASSVATRAAPLGLPRKKRGLLGELVRHRYLLLLLLPGIAYFIIFRYIPMYGIVLAFKDFDVNKGILFSPFVGLKYFRRFFEMSAIGHVFWNTIRISALRMLVGFPAPIILALLLNELKGMAFKRTVQTISYLPYFLSWIVVAGLITEILSPSRGVVGFIGNLFNVRVGVLLTSKVAFVPILLISDVWKGVGWGTVIYLATISTINPELYEAAIMDGARRFRQAINITLPGLIAVITILAVLTVGNILNGGFDQIFNLYNPAVYEVADILDTYIYRVGLAGFEYSFATAVGLSRNLIAFALVLGTNLIVRKFSDYALW